jgi:hypothetical protein
VIPILVDEAGRGRVTSTLAPLVRRNAVEISGLMSDVKRLIATLRQTLAYTRIADADFLSRYQ